VGKITPIPLKGRPGVTAPAPLAPEHILDEFSCGKEALDDWLRFKALRSESRSARTYVTCLGQRVVGYYSFASGAVRLDELPKKLRRNMPTLCPVTLLGRLAVDRRFQGLGLGKGLLRDALSRALHASEIIGSRAVMVHAIDDEAAAFYAAFGFQRFPEESQTFFLPMETIAKAIS